MMRPRVARYVDAVRGLRALRRAVEEEGRTEGRAHALLDAKAEVESARGPLRGREIAEGDRMLAADREG